MDKERYKDFYKKQTEYIDIREAEVEEPDYSEPRRKSNRNKKSTNGFVLSIISVALSLVSCTISLMTIAVLGKEPKIQENPIDEEYIKDIVYGYMEENDDRTETCQPDYSQSFTEEYYNQEDSEGTSNIIDEESDYEDYKEDEVVENDTEIEETQEPEEKEESESQISREDFISSCEEIPYKTIARNPEEYKGKHIKLTARVSQVIQGGFFDSNEYYRMTTNDEYDMWLGDEYFMYDHRENKEPKILQDDILTIYAECDGTTTVKRALSGTKEDVVSINAIYIEFVDEDSYSVNYFEYEY